MKEYKVVTPKLGFRNRSQKYEDLLNQHAREGWVVNTIFSKHWRYSFRKRQK